MERFLKRMLAVLWLSAPVASASVAIATAGGCTREPAVPLANAAMPAAQATSARDDGPTLVIQRAPGSRGSGSEHCRASEVRAFRVRRWRRRSFRPSRGTKALRLATRWTSCSRAARSARRTVRWRVACVRPIWRKRRRCLLHRPVRSVAARKSYRTWRRTPVLALRDRGRRRRAKAWSSAR